MSRRKTVHLRKNGEKGGIATREKHPEHFHVAGQLSYAARVEKFGDEELRKRLSAAGRKSAEVKKLRKAAAELRRLKRQEARVRKMAIVYKETRPSFVTSVSKFLTGK